MPWYHIPSQSELIFFFDHRESNAMQWYRVLIHS